MMALLTSLTRGDPAITNEPIFFTQISDIVQILMPLPVSSTHTARIIFTNTTHSNTPVAGADVMGLHVLPGSAQYGFAAFAARKIDCPDSLLCVQNLQTLCRKEILRNLRSTTSHVGVKNCLLPWQFLELMLVGPRIELIFFCHHPSCRSYLVRLRLAAKTPKMTRKPTIPATLLPVGSTIAL